MENAFFNATMFQPVLPVQLNDKWRVINRPVFTLMNFETPTSGFDYTPGGSFDPAGVASSFRNMSGLGDTAFIQWFSNQLRILKWFPVLE